MKILCEFTPGGPQFVRSGWGRAFISAGHEFSFWDREGKSAFDVFDEYDPGCLLSTTYGLDRALLKCVQERPQLKVGLFASAWGPLADSLDKELFPIVRVTDEEKRNVAELKKTHDPFLFIHVTDEYLERTLGGWRELGVPIMGVLNALDAAVYFPVKPDPSLECCVGFVGGRWPFKARNLDPYILPLCQPDSGLNVKIFGRGGWEGVPQYLGSISQDTERALYCSAKVCPNISEPHATVAGQDIVERPFKVMGCGGMVVSDYVGEAAEVVFKDGEMVFARSPREFADLVKHFARHPEDSLPYREKALKKVWAEHTYHHRVAKMFDAWGLPEEKGPVLEALEKIKKERL